MTTTKDDNDQVTKNRQWILKARPEGDITPSLFELKTTLVPSPLPSGHVLAKTLYLSFDPTQRGWIAMDTYLPKVPLGEPMRAGGIAQVIQSNHNKFKPGDLVTGFCNWQEYVLFDPQDKSSGLEFQKLPGHVDPTRMLCFIPTAITAYFGMLEIGKLKSTDTVLVSGAAGATGSVAGQISKIKGCQKVIGIAGGPDKCKWLVEKAHFDGVIDYKNENVEERLAALCPDGIDVYYDNVGGEILDLALMNLAMNARVVLCGAISQYNKHKSQHVGIKNLAQLIGKRGVAQGFIVLDYKDRFTEAIMCLDKWVHDGKLVLEFDMQTGFEQVPATLQRIFTGANTGKQILKVCDAPLAVSSSVIEQVVMNIMRTIFGFWKG